MKYITLEKFPDRKKVAICVHDTEQENVAYIIGYVNHNQELFEEALADSKNVEYVLKDQGE